MNVLRRGQTLDILADGADGNGFRLVKDARILEESRLMLMFLA